MRRVLNGLAAIAGLAAALLGLPWLLLNVATALADLIPDWSQLPTELLSPGDGGLFLAMVLLVGWVCWVTFVIALIVELVARARGVSAPRLGRFFPQVTAARAVTAVVVMFATVTPQVAQATPATATPVTAAPPVAAAVPARDASALTGRHYERYTVERGDTLWEVSGDELGDPQRYPEIYRASKAIEQPDGQRLTDPNLIQPGWKLRIPVVKARKKPAPVPATPAPVPTRASSPEPQASTPQPVATPTPEAQRPEEGATARLPENPLVPATSPKTQLDTPLIIDDHQTDAIVDTPLKPVLTGLPDWITTPLIPVPRD